MHHGYAAAHGDQKRAPDSLDLDLQVTVGDCVLSRGYRELNWGPIAGAVHICTHTHALDTQPLFSVSLAVFTSVPQHLFLLLFLRCVRDTQTYMYFIHAINACEHVYIYIRDHYHHNGSNKYI